MLVASLLMMRVKGGVRVVHVGMCGTALGCRGSRQRVRLFLQRHHEAVALRG